MHFLNQESVFGAVIRYTSENPWLWAVYVVIIAVTVVLVVITCCTSSKVICIPLISIIPF